MVNKHDDPLDGFFEAARSVSPQPSDALQRRILADADAVLMAGITPAPRRLRFAAALAVLGGWPTMAGLMTAAVAGLWIGVSPPQLIEGLMGVQTVEYLPGFNALLEEG